MIRKWKFISRKPLLDHPRMTIVEDTVELPDGRQVTYLRQAPDSNYGVGILAFNDKGELLLQREYSYPPDEVMYQNPGGGAQAGEEIIEAANRELSEESGYTASDCRVLGYFYVNNRRSNRKQYVVLCRKLQQHKLPQDAEEFIENEWVTLDRLNELIRSGKITNMNLLAALQLYYASTNA